MSLEAAYRTGLLAYPPLQARVSSRIYRNHFPDRKPEGAKASRDRYPCLIYWRITGEEEECYDDLSDAGERRFQWNGQSARDSDEAEEVMDLWADANRWLIGQTVLGFRFDHIEIFENGEGWNSDLELAIDSRDSLVSYQRV